MASRRDNRNRRNALLKWQLLQDQKRRVEVQQRLMRMAAQSPSSLSLDNSFDRRPTVRRPRPVHDPDEDALMSLIMEREEREATTSNQYIDKSSGSKPSKLQYPSVLPPLRRPKGSKPLTNSVKNVTLRPTGQKLNAAGDFYSPVRPQESSLNSSTSDFRQNLNFSRIKTPTPKRLVGATAAPSPRNPLMYDQMKTPDRWRTTAMRSNQEEVNESALKRWEEEDARQADRLLEKAARDGDNDALWNDFFYGTKAARAKTNQLPEQPVVYSTSSFPEMFSRSRSNSQDNSCYEARDDQIKSPEMSSVGKDEMLPSDLSTMYTSEQTKPSTIQHCDGSHAANSNAPTSTQTISEMLASMDKSDYVEPVTGDLVAGGDKNFDGSSGGGDRERFSRGEVSADGSEFVQGGTLPGIEFPRWSVIVVVSCLVVGASGFFMKELMALMGLFSKRTPFTLSRGEQERMRDRVSVLQQELKGFQLSTSEIEVKSQTILTELRLHMDRMRIDREKHQDMLATEMQELRHHILHVTHEMVEKERKSIQAHLEEMVKIQVINEGEAETCTSVSGVDIENDKTLEGTTSKPSTKGESDAAVDALPGLSADIELDRKINDEQTRDEQLSSERSQEQAVVVRKTNDFTTSPVQSSTKLDNVQVQVEQAIPKKEVELVVDPSQSSTLDNVQVQAEQTIPEKDVVAPSQSSTFNNVQVPIERTIPQNEEDVVIAPPQSFPKEFVNAQNNPTKSAQVHTEEVNVQEVAVAPVPVLEQDRNDIDISVAPAPKVKVIAKSPRNASGMSWDGILLLVGIMFLAACVVLRVYNINRRKRWFEERRKRRNQRALLLAQRRARAMADNQEDSDDWDTDGVEEVKLMTPERDSEDGESKSEQHQSPDTDTDTDFEDSNQSEQTSYSSAPAYRQATTEQRVTTSTHTKRSYNHGSPLLLRQRSPRQHQQQH